MLFIMIQLKWYSNTIKDFFFCLPVVPFNSTSISFKISHIEALIVCELWMSDARRSTKGRKRWKLKGSITFLVFITFFFSLHSDFKRMNFYRTCWVRFFVTLSFKWSKKVSFLCCLHYKRCTKNLHYLRTKWNVCNLKSKSAGDT